MQKQTEEFNIAKQENSELKKLLTKNAAVATSQQTGKGSASTTPRSNKRDSAQVSPTKDKDPEDIADAGAEVEDAAKRHRLQEKPSISSYAAHLEEKKRQEF